MLQILMVKGCCPVAAAVLHSLRACAIEVVEFGQDAPLGAFDIEVVETHLSSEQWKRLWDRERERTVNQRIHLCLNEPLSAIILRDLIKEYQRCR